MPEEQTNDLGTQVFVFDPDGPIDELTDQIGPGFGSQRNKYSWSGTLFDGDGDGVEELYIGTFNVELSFTGTLAGAVRLSSLVQAGGFGDDLTDLITAEFPKVLQSSGGEIWRYDFATEEWTEVAGPDLPFIDNGDAGFREMTTFGGKIFASTSKGLIYNILNASDNAAKIVFSEDGETWNELTGGPLDPAEGNSSIRSMTVVEIPAFGGGTTDVMIVGTENVESGAQIWMYDQLGNWTKIASLPVGTVAEVLQTDDGIFVGTWAPYALLQIEFGPTGPSLNNVTPVVLTGAPPAPEPLIDDDGVMQMIEYDGYFYMGSVSYLGGTSLIRTTDPTDPLSWEVITTDGFRTDATGDELLADEMGANDVEQAIYTWQMAVVEGSLYIGDFNGERGQLIRITTTGDTGENIHNGLEFEILPDEFGSLAYGLRRFIPVHLDEDGLPDSEGDPNALIIGSADPFYTPTDTPLGDLDPDNAIMGTFFQDDLEGGEDGDMIIGLHAGDTIAGNGGYDLILGDGGVELFGNDSLLGGEGYDTILGELGDDTIDGGSGDDFIIGGSGGDVIIGGEGIDFIVGDVILDEDLEASLAAAGQLAGIQLPTLEQAFAQLTQSLAAENPDLADALNAALELSTDFTNPVGNFADQIEGNCGADIIFGGFGDDTIDGGGGRDILFGGDDNDLLSGSFDEDILNGGEGNDTLDGGADLDVQTGNAGQDTFRFDLYDSSADDTARDRITDFSGSGGDGDLLDISSFATSFIGGAAFSGTSGEARFEQVDGNTIVSVDADGDSVADFSIQLNGLVTPVEADFVLGTDPVIHMSEASETLEQEDASIGFEYRWAIRQTGPTQVGTLVLQLDQTDRNTIHQLQLASGVVLLGASAENALIQQDGDILIVTDNECRSEITLEFEVSDDFPENAVLLTSHLGDGDPVVGEFDRATDQSLVAAFGGEGIIARAVTGVGDGDVQLTPTLGEGSAVGGFHHGDSIVIAKDPSHTPVIEIEPHGGPNGGAIVKIDGVVHIIQFDPDALGGEVMVLDMGDSIKFQYMNYLPDLNNGDAVDPSQVNGVANTDFLTGVDGRNFEVTLEDLGVADYENVVGSYQIAPDGSISNIRILFENTNTDVGDTEVLSGVPAGHQVGFFVIQDGADWLDTLADLDSFTFVELDGDPGNADAGAALFLAVDGTLQGDVTVLHSYDPTLNADGMEHVLTGINPGEQTITLGFEDMTGGGDYDFEDVGLLIALSDGVTV